VSAPAIIHPSVADTPSAGPAALTAAVREALVRDLGALYRDLEQEIAAHNPLCRRSGDCCQFANYGHALYASRAEALYFALHHAPPAGPVGHESCPYLSGGRCTARKGRPLGCRVFFCDPAFAGKAEVLTERSLRSLGALSDRLGLPWDYRPFTQHLEAMGEGLWPAGDGGEPWRSW
jgi:hypothetical protein